MDEATRQEICRVAERTLRDAGLTEPPLPIEALLEHLRLYRDYYDLEDPGFLDRAKFKLQIHGRKLVDILSKVRLKAVLLFDENRICIDEALPKIKHPWASCHEAGHRLLPWHKPYFYADTAETLDPAWQEDLEQEAHYAAARLLVLGDRFRADARDTLPTIAGLKALAKRYGTSLTATLRRYVADGPDLVMANAPRPTLADRLRDIFSDEALARLRGRATPPGHPLARSTVVAADSSSPDPPRKLRRALRDAWRHYLSAAFALGLFDAPHGADLRARLTDPDDEMGRAAMKECMMGWVLA